MESQEAVEGLISEDGQAKEMFGLKHTQKRIQWYKNRLECLELKNSEKYTETESREYILK